MARPFFNKVEIADTDSEPTHIYVHDLLLPIFDPGGVNAALDYLDHHGLFPLENEVTHSF